MRYDTIDYVCKGGEAVYGYIRTYAPELKVREQEYYRAAYCGLCRAMGECTGQRSRLTLSYDFTFFALMRMAITGEPAATRRRRCLLHPFRRRPMMEISDPLILSAYASALLVYHKNRDDRADERGGKRLRATLLAPYTRGLRRDVRRHYESLDDEVAAIMARLSELEASLPPSVDRPAEVFGELMAYLLSWRLEGGEQTLAKTIGRHVGRWVYIIDAADDFEEDVKKGRYNPLACLYNDPNMATLPEHKRQEIRTALTAELAGLESALDLMEITDRDLDGVLKNILYYGMPAMAEKVLFGDKNTPSEPEVGNGEEMAATEKKKKTLCGYESKSEFCCDCCAECCCELGCEACDGPC